MSHIRQGAALLVLLVGAMSARAAPPDETVAYWRAQLHAPDARGREAAARGIQLAGLAAKEAVPDLITALGDASPEVRVAACDAIAALHREAGAAARPLARIIASEPSPDVRAAAVKALQQLGDRARAAVPDLIAVIEPPPRPNPGAPASTVPVPVGNEDARTAAATVLGRIADVDRATEASAARALETSMIHDPAKRTRQAARASLDRLRREPTSLVPALVRALDDPEPSVRRVATEWLAEQPSTAGPAVPKLTRLATTDPDVVVRKGAAGALAAMGPEARAAVPPLLAVVLGRGTPAPMERQRAGSAKLVGRIGSGRDGEVDALTHAMVTDPKLIVRQSSRSALARMARREPGVVTQLAALVGGKDDAIAEAAAETLGVIGDDAAPAVAALMEAAENGSEPVRHAAVHALGKIGAPAESALPLLSQSQRDRSDRVRTGARKAIDAIRRAQARAAHASESAGTPSK